MVTMASRQSLSPQATQSLLTIPWSTRSLRTTVVCAGATRREAVLSSFMVLPLGLLGGLVEETVPEVGSCPTCIGVVDGTLGSCASAGPCLSSFDDRPGHFVAPWQYDDPSMQAAQTRLVQAIRDAGGQVVSSSSLGSSSGSGGSSSSSSSSSNVTGSSSDVTGSSSDSSGGGSQQVTLAAGGPGSQATAKGAEQAAAAAAAVYGYVYAVFSGRGGSDDLEFLFQPNDNTVVLRAAPRARALPDFGRNGIRLEELRKDLGWEQVPILRNRKRALLFVESPFDTFGPTPPAGGMDYGSSEAFPIPQDAGPLLGPLLSND